MAFDAFSEALTYADMARSTDAETAAGVAATAQAFALIAVVEELRALRESVESVAETLRDGQGFDVGSHSRTISQALESISRNT